MRQARSAQARALSYSAAPTTWRARADEMKSCATRLTLNMRGAIARERRSRQIADTEAPCLRYDMQRGPRRSGSHGVPWWPRPRPPAAGVWDSASHEPHKANGELHGKGLPCGLVARKRWAGPVRRVHRLLLLRGHPGGREARQAATASPDHRAKRRWRFGAPATRRRRLHSPGRAGLQRVRPAAWGLPQF